MAGRARRLDEPGDAQAAPGDGVEEARPAHQAGPASALLELKVGRKNRGEGIGFVQETAD